MPALMSLLFLLQSDPQQLAWRQTVAAKSVGEPCMAKDDLFFVDSTGASHCISAVDGKKRWSKIAGKRRMAQPACDDGMVYFASESGVAACSRKTGDEVWTFPMDGGAGCVAVDRTTKRIIAAGRDGHLVAIDPNGKQIWRVDLVIERPDLPGEKDDRQGRPPGVAARPVGAKIIGDWVFVSLYDQRRIAAFDVAEGLQRSAYRARSWISAPVDGTAGTLFLTSAEGNVICLDGQSAEPVWTKKLDTPIEAAPAVDLHTVYTVTNDGRMFALARANGELRWKLDRGNGQSKTLSGSPATVGTDMVIAGTDAGEVVAIHRVSGKPAWSVRATDKPSPTRIFSDGNRLMAISSPQSGGPPECTLAGISVQASGAPAAAAR